MRRPASVPGTVPRRLPWVVCAVSLSLYAASLALQLTLPPAPGESPRSASEATLELIGFLGIPVVGALIAARMPANRYGWVLCALGFDYGVLAVAAASGGLPGAGARVAGLLEGYSFLVLLLVVVHVFLWFPTGRPPSRAWNGLTLLAVVLTVWTGLAAVFAAAADPLDHGGPLALGGAAGRWWAGAVDLGITALFWVGVGAMCSVLPRYRRAGTVERRQLEWFLLAAAVNVATVLLDLSGLLRSDGAWRLIDAVTFSLVPVAIGVAVLRYRLYEIDRIVSRTVSYAVLTAALLAVYVGVVTALRGLLAPMTGSSELAVAASTLAVAAAFGPARRRVQAVVDRRFDRARYDAARTVDAYVRRLRSEVDLDQMTAGLRDTVSATVGPQRVGVWLRAAGTRQP